MVGLRHMKLTPAQLGALRGLGVIIVMAVLTWLGDASHLNGLVSAGTATLIAVFASSVEQHLSDGSATALFGTVTKA